MKFVLIIILTLILPPVSLAGDQEGVIVRSATVYQEANAASTRMGQIAAGSRVSIFSRSGGWKEIYSEEKSVTGWIRGYQGREGNFTQAAEAQAEPDSRGLLSGLAAFSRKASSFFNFGSSNTSTSSGTATIGVRGLSEQQIKSAEPDPEELKRMLEFASNVNRVVRFQSDGELKSRDVDYLASKPESAAKPKTTEK